MPFCVVDAEPGVASKRKATVNFVTRVRRIL